uniref:ATP synthase complex subunit 8 n=1 Tax=Melanocharis citreola TaxID=2794625 RepID=A0A8H2SN95_9PASE|nr:ATP synthase F0 subunit 8 [Melanocharis citreola]QWS05523.1 ATP synthase F0 subunit 8 [Melanocharis citreola]QWS05549.1 ATP synthase F0 subunit 8 [Melanocharis citreola]
MPQLNPSPWLFIMITSWLTYSLIIQPKILTFLTTNPPHNKTTTASSTNPWTWPWT